MPPTPKKNFALQQTQHQQTHLQQSQLHRFQPPHSTSKQHHKFFNLTLPPSTLTHEPSPILALSRATSTRPRSSRPSPPPRSHKSLLSTLSHKPPTTTLLSPNPPARSHNHPPFLTFTQSLTPQQPSSLIGSCSAYHGYFSPLQSFRSLLLPATLQLGHTGAYQHLTLSTMLRATSSPITDYNTFFREAPMSRHNL